MLLTYYFILGFQFLNRFYLKHQLLLNIIVIMNRRDIKNQLNKVKSKCIIRYGAIHSKYSIIQLEYYIDVLLRFENPTPTQERMYLSSVPVCVSSSGDLRTGSILYITLKKSLICLINCTV